MVFSKTKVDLSSIKPLTIDDGIVEFTNQIKYLGTSITNDRAFSFSNEDDLRAFYRSSNSILNHLQSPDESISMQLLYSHCVPCLSYACSVKEYPTKQMTDCSVALNDAIRKIFTFHRWESVRFLREGFGYLSLTEIFSKARNKFLGSLSHHSNKTIVQLDTFTSSERCFAFSFFNSLCLSSGLGLLYCLLFASVTL